MSFSGWVSGRALIALGKETKSVNLLDEVAHASPAPEAEADYQHPYHYKCVHCIHGCPAREEARWFLCRILHTQNHTTKRFGKIKRSVIQRYEGQHLVKAGTRQVNFVGPGPTRRAGLAQVGRTRTVMG